MGYEKGKAHNGKRGSSKGSGDGKQRVAGFQFVRYSPTKSDKARINSIGITGNQALVSVIGEVESGYKFSLSYKPEDETFTASLTCTDLQATNGGLILTGRGGSPETAVVWLWYLHAFAFERVWVSQEERESWEL